MNLSDVLHSIQLSNNSEIVMELVRLNETTKEQGLILTSNEAKSLLAFRKKVLRDHARIELSTGVLKELILVFSASPYIDQDHYIEILNELQEIFYYLKNETEDTIGDSKLIQQMSDFYNGPCAGSLELLRSKMEELAETSRSNIVQHNSLWERDE